MDLLQEGKSPKISNKNHLCSTNGYENTAYTQPIAIKIGTLGVHNELNRFHATVFKITISTESYSQKFKTPTKNNMEDNNNNKAEISNT